MHPLECVCMCVYYNWSNQDCNWSTVAIKLSKQRSGLFRKSCCSFINCLHFVCLLALHYDGRGGVDGLNLFSIKHRNRKFKTLRSAMALRARPLFPFPHPNTKEKSGLAIATRDCSRRGYRIIQ